MPVSTLGNQTIEAKQFYNRDLLLRATQVCAFANKGTVKNLPINSGNSVSYRRFNALSTITSPLTEGVTPASQSASISEITGTVAQYGGYIEYSDAIDDMGIDPFVSEMMNVLGQQGGESVDAITVNELVNGTSVLYGTGSARNAQSSANPLTYLLVRRAVRTLKANNAMPYYGDRGENGLGGMFLGFIHPNQFHDLKGDTAVQNVLIYNSASGEKFYTQRIPELGQVVWIETTLAPVFAGQGSGAADVYGAIIVGQEAYGVLGFKPDLKGGMRKGSFMSFVEAPGSAGAADPMHQRGTAAWKAYQLPKILNNNYMVRIETGVSA